MLKELNLARELLSRRGLWNEEMTMVLFAMLAEGIGYAEALRSYAQFAARSCASIEQAMDAAAAAAGQWVGARYILEECYRRAIR